MKATWPLLLLLVGLFLACEQEIPYTRAPADTPPAYAQYGTPFEAVPENADVVMYEVNLRALGGSGLQGVIDRLDAIQALGVNVIWLMPIHPIGAVNSVNSPYSVRDYKAVVDEYGNLADLRRLTDAAHARGIAVILDWVANHTAWDHPWITNAGWYTTDGSGNIVHPPGTNWLDVADLDFGNRAMRLAMIDAMKYWVLEANVDGYRCDYADGVPADFWAQAFDTLAAIPGREYVLLAEGARTDHFAAGFDLNFGWSYYGALKEVFENGRPVSTLIEVHQNAYRQVPAGKEQLRFTTNHDESAWDRTPIAIFGGQAGALAASVATIFLDGAPLIYSSQEIGRVNNLPFFSTTPLDWSVNPDFRRRYEELLNYYAQAEVARRGTTTGYPDEDVLCFTRSLNGNQLLVLVNTRSEAVDFALPPTLRDSDWTDVLTGAAVLLSASQPLPPYAYRLLLR
jgi:glycosidase